MCESQDIRLQRSSCLDLLRFFLCVGVVVYHYTPERPSSGPFMVIGFIVLSGFLVGRMLFRLQTFDIVAFYRKKAVRLLPMFAFAWLFGVACRLLYWIVDDGAPPFLPPINWGKISMVEFVGYYNMPCWYMVVEFAFLLLVPFLFALTRKRWGIALFTLLSGLFSAFLFSRIPFRTPFGGGLYFSPVARIWQFSAGILAAQCSFSLIGAAGSRRIRTSLTLVLSVATVVLGSVLFVVKQYTTLECWNYTFVFDFACVILFSVLIPLLYDTRLNFTTQACKRIADLALLTYPVYLLHVPVCSIVLRFLGKVSVEFELEGVNEPVFVAFVSISATLFVAAVLLRLQKRYIG